MAATETITQVGGQGGSLSSLDYSPWIRMAKIAVWAANDTIRGVQIWSSNDTDETAAKLGTQEGVFRDFNIPSTQWINSLSLWDNGEGTRLGWIKIKLSGGSIFDFGLTGEGEKGKERKISVGSGICVGWTARSGYNVDALGFKFLAMVTTEAITEVGGRGKFKRGEDYPPGIRMAKIAVWAGATLVRGVKIWSSNDTNDEMAAVIGSTADGAYSDFSIPSTERIKSLSLWPNDSGTLLGWIKIELSGGSIFDFGQVEKKKRGKEHKVSVGSGICVGWTGESERYVDKLGFKFLLPIQSSQIVDITYPTLGMQASSIQPKTLAWYRNQHSGGPTSINWNWQRSYMLKTSSTFKWNVGMIAGGKIKISGGVPFIATNETEVVFGVSDSISQSTTYEEQEELMLHLGGTLEPGQSVELVAKTYEASVNDVKYNAVMEITLEPKEPKGAIYRYPFTGKYDGVFYSDVNLTTTGSSKGAINHQEICRSSVPVCHCPPYPT